VEPITADYNDMIYDTTPEEIEVRGEAFIRKWRLKHRAVADRMEEAGECLFTFTRVPTSIGAVYAPQMQSSVGTKNLSDGSRRKLFCHLPSADTTAMLFWALLASDQRAQVGWLPDARHKTH